MPHFLPIILFGFAALLLFGFGHLLARRNRADTSGDDGMQKLDEAAAAAYETARRERMPLAAIAEMASDPVRWFARNLANIVGAWKNNKAGGYEAAKGDGDTQSLYIRRRDLANYLRWARTVK
jgi:hypothetical protein